MRDLSRAENKAMLNTEPTPDAPKMSRAFKDALGDEVVNRKNEEGEKAPENGRRDAGR